MATSNITPVPLLSAAGWTRSPSEKADALMSHWFESDKSQSLLYGPEVSSLAYVLQEHFSEPVAFMSALKASLEKYLGRYYSGVVVEARAPELFTDPGPKVEVKLYIQVVEGTQMYSFGKLLQISNSKLEKVLNLNNNGQQPS
jgi:hypothetical protein